MNKHVIEILKKQCELVGANYKDIDFNDDTWFFEYQWTKDQESEFIEWMTDYLSGNKEARRDLMNVPGKSKSLCKQVAQAFAFNFGWKYKE